MKIDANRCKKCKNIKGKKITKIKNSPAPAIR